MFIHPSIHSSIHSFPCRWSIQRKQPGAWRTGAQRGKTGSGVCSLFVCLALWTPFLFRCHQPGPGDRRTPPEADPRMGGAPPPGPPLGPMDGPFPRRAPYGPPPPDFYPPRGPGVPPMMPSKQSGLLKTMLSIDSIRFNLEFYLLLSPVWAPPPPGMMFPPRFPPGGPPLPPASHSHPPPHMRPDFFPPPSVGPLPPQQSLPSPPQDQAPEEHPPSAEEAIWAWASFLELWDVWMDGWMGRFLFYISLASAYESGVGKPWAFMNPLCLCCLFLLCWTSSLLLLNLLFFSFTYCYSRSAPSSSSSCILIEVRLIAVTMAVTEVWSFHMQERSSLICASVRGSVATWTRNSRLFARHCDDNEGVQHFISSWRPASF